MLETQLDTLRKRGINPYRATVMAAMEARAVNTKVLQGIAEEKDKPTTIALRKVLDGRVVLTTEEALEG